MCVCVCICMFAHLRTHIHTYIYIYTYIHTYIHTYMLTCLHAYILTYSHTYFRSYLLTYLLTYLITYLPIELYTQVYHNTSLILRGPSHSIRHCPIAYTEKPWSPSSLVVNVPTGQQRDDIRALEILVTECRFGIALHHRCIRKSI